MTHYRGSMLVVTCLAILAVDFPVFPRRFAKVETWGTSLMDLGVGSFVFSAGVVSARGLIKSEQQPGSDGGASGRSKSTFIARFAQALRHSIPLLILGFIRLWSVKGLDYAEHVTEYGVHWNFFFTLGFLPPFAELSDTITRRLVKRYEILAILLAVVYEIVLNNTELLRYILVSPRGPDLLSKNREGVFSFIGYLSIFLSGRGTGVFVMQYQDSTDDTTTRNKALHKTNTDNDTATKQERQVVLKKLATQSAIHGIFFLLSTTVYAFNLNVSRRLANLPYVLWIVAFNNAQILLFGLVESLGPSFSYTAEDADKLKDATSLLLRVYNSNGLAIFLVANLLTGLVNLTVNTLDMSNIAAMAVLIAYAAAVTGFAAALHFSGVKIKL
jgi:phosphatidylinositol glycan class W